MATKYYDPLSDLSRIKLSLMELFKDTDDITNLIMPHLDNENFTFDENWYGGKFEKNINEETQITDLVGHCFDTPYIEGTVTDNRCAIFVETYLLKVENQHVKEVGVDVMVICHKNSVRLSEADKQYYESVGVYGNRVDSAIQIINSTILNHNVMDNIKKDFSIGKLTLSERGNPLQQYVPGTKFYGKVLHYTYQAFYQRKNNER